jgi:GrpB-like predicted nucleotidyltransferase (UPF0157 family)
VTERLQPPDPGSDVVLVEPDPAWAGVFATQERRIRGALGAHALEVHHVGSTSVPGLAAKDVVDVVLVVRDPASERAYVPALEDAGYTLAVREPDWYEHRVLKDRAPRVNLHVFGPACPEVRRMLAFRDHLRRDAEDRERYEATKRDLAGRTWQQVQDYADAKSEVVTAILARALPEG